MVGIDEFFVACFPWPPPGALSRVVSRGALCADGVVVGVPKNAVARHGQGDIDIRDQLPDCVIKDRSWE